MQISKLLYKYTPRSIRRIAGKSRILKPFRDLLLRRKGSYKEINVLIQKKYNDFEVNFNFYASIQVAIKGQNRGIENKLLRHSISLLKQYKSQHQNNIVLDVGANFGFLSLVWANSIASNGQVYSFEPHPYLINSIKKSISANSLTELMQPIHTAVGNRNGEIDIGLYHYSSNILENKNKNRVKKITVPIISIDDWFTVNKHYKCDLIKIDVDGYELEILKGAINTIKKCKPILIVEINDDSEIIPFLETQNYRAFNDDLLPYDSEQNLPQNAYFVFNQ